MANICEHCGATHEETESEIAVTSEADIRTKYILINKENSEHISRISDDINTMKYIMIFWFILTLIAILFGYNLYTDYLDFVEKLDKIF